MPLPIRTMALFYQIDGANASLTITLIWFTHRWGLVGNCPMDPTSDLTIRHLESRTHMQRFMLLPHNETILLCARDRKRDGERKINCIHGDSSIIIMSSRESRRASLSRFGSLRNLGRNKSNGNSGFVCMDDASENSELGDNVSLLASSSPRRGSGRKHMSGRDLMMGMSPLNLKQKLNHSSRDLMMSGGASLPSANKQKLPQISTSSSSIRSEDAEPVPTMEKRGTKSSSNHSKGSSSRRSRTIKNNHKPPKPPLPEQAPKVRGSGESSSDSRRGGRPPLLKKQKSASSLLSLSRKQSRRSSTGDGGGGEAGSSSKHRSRRQHSPDRSVQSKKSTGGGKSSKSGRGRFGSPLRRNESRSSSGESSRKGSPLRRTESRRGLLGKKSRSIRGSKAFLQMDDSSECELSIDQKENIKQEDIGSDPTCLLVDDDEEENRDEEQHHSQDEPYKHHSPRKQPHPQSRSQPLEEPSEADMQEVKDIHDFHISSSDILHHAQFSPEAALRGTNASGRILSASCSALNFDISTLPPPTPPTPVRPEVSPEQDRPLPPPTPPSPRRERPPRPSLSASAIPSSASPESRESRAAMLQRSRSTNHVLNNGSSSSRRNLLASRKTASYNGPSRSSAAGSSCIAQRGLERSTSSRSKNGRRVPNLTVH